MDQTHEHKDLAASANGRASGKSWKLTKNATVYDVASFVLSSCFDQTATSRSQSSAGCKTKWHVRMEKTKSKHAVKKLESELKQEKRIEKQR